MDMLAKFPAITLSTAIETFAPLFILAHHWNEGDVYRQLLGNKRKFVQDTLLTAVSSGQLKGNVIRKPVYGPDGVPFVIGDADQVETELDVQETWFDMDGATSLLFGLLKSKKCRALDMLQRVSGHQLVEEDVIDQEIIANVEAMPLPILKKKVKELTNEKVKWDRSIEVATKIGLLFYEKELQKPATEAAFIAEYDKWFIGIPKKTVSMIYKSLPEGYRNTGTRPATKVDGIDEETVDTILEASVVAGFITQKEGAREIADLKDRLEGDDVMVPSNDYMKRIAGTCKRIALKYK